VKLTFVFVDSSGASTRIVKSVAVRSR
jgi:hypothetical protein